MKYLKYLLIVLVFVSCSSDNSETIVINNSSSLSNDIEGRIIELEAVIACAASISENSNVVEVYFYPEIGASNFKLYETNSVAVDAANFENYRQIAQLAEPFFNGFLQKFVRPFKSEQWLIVTYELNNEVKISNPIRTKNVSQPTNYTDTINIDQSISLMPIFNWEVSSNNNAIFFQLLSTIDDGALSGTYTFDRHF
ncbi:MAG: hypothetical protein EVB11_06590 [Winogradskyella sp.]|nr:MAG: hypothetical protein EVB11_06590 [Winogradskyella sp.]